MDRQTSGKGRLELSGHREHDSATKLSLAMSQRDAGRRVLLLFIRSMSQRAEMPRHISLVNAIVTSLRKRSTAASENRGVLGERTRRAGGVSTIDERDS